MNKKQTYAETPEEIADRIVGQSVEGDPWIDGYYVDAVREAIVEAIKAERRVCRVSQNIGTTLISDQNGKY